jgi:hypothetical protein
MAYNQEAFDAECAALARALEVAARRQSIPERVTIFTAAQAVIRRISSEEPGPGPKYAIQARKWIAALRKVRPGIHHRNPVAPGAPRGYWERKGR